MIEVCDHDYKDIVYLVSCMPSALHAYNKNRMLRLLFTANPSFSEQTVY